MSTCKKCQKLFADALYGSPGDAEKSFFEKHLAECENCRTALDKLVLTKEEVNRYERPDPGNEFWDVYWSKLAARLEDEEKKSANVFDLNRFRRWSGQHKYRLAAAAAIFLCGIFLGRYFSFEPDQSSNRTGLRSQSAHNAALTQRYLERSKIMLLGLVNTDYNGEEGNNPDLGKQKLLSRQLLTEATLIKDNLQKDKRLVLYELISELEIILVQIANLEEEYDLEAVELIQSSIERKGVLFKINLENILNTVRTDSVSQKSTKKDI